MSEIVDQEPEDRKSDPLPPADSVPSGIARYEDHPIAAMFPLRDDSGIRDLAEDIRVRGRNLAQACAMVGHALLGFRSLTDNLSQLDISGLAGDSRAASRRLALATTIRDLRRGGARRRRVLQSSGGSGRKSWSGRRVGTS